MGVDILSAIAGACKRHPNKNLIVVDMGTATTIFMVNKSQKILGGTILTGAKTTYEALIKKASLLKTENITFNAPSKVVGNTTQDCLLSGAYYGHIGAIKEVIWLMKEEYKNDEFVVVSTGGIASHYKNEKTFDYYYPYLVLEGMRDKDKVLALNK